MWIGDFVRCHSVVRLLKSAGPDRPVDVLTTTLCAPLLDYMPGVRKGIVCDLPRKRLALGEHRALAERLRPEGYGQRAGHAAHLEIGAGAVSRRHPGAHRLRRRSSASACSTTCASARRRCRA